jgi:hypothetical protein
MICTLLLLLPEVPAMVVYVSIVLVLLIIARSAIIVIRSKKKIVGGVVKEIKVFPESHDVANYRIVPVHQAVLLGAENPIINGKWLYADITMTLAPGDEVKVACWPYSTVMKIVPRICGKKY